MGGCCATNHFSALPGNIDVRVDDLFKANKPEYQVVDSATFEIGEAPLFKVDDSEYVVNDEADSVVVQVGKMPNKPDRDKSLY